MYQADDISAAFKSMTIDALNGKLSVSSLERIKADFQMSRLDPVC